MYTLELRTVSVTSEYLIVNRSLLHNNNFTVSSNEVSSSTGQTSEQPKPSTTPGRGKCRTSRPIKIVNTSLNI